MVMCHYKIGVRVEIYIYIILDSIVKTTVRTYVDLALKKEDCYFDLLLLLHLKIDFPT